MTKLIKHLLLCFLFIFFSCSKEEYVPIPPSVEKVIPEFLPTLSEINIYSGNLYNLKPTDGVIQYDLSSPLHTDYAKKQRLVSLPEGKTMQYIDSDLPDFPDNTLFAKTFYYYMDDNNPFSEKKIIETRVMIKKNGVWETGNYLWNEEQTDATLITTNDEPIAAVPITWKSLKGRLYSINYQIPTNKDCIVCHQSYDKTVLLGPELRNLNFDLFGSNQLQYFIDRRLITDAPNASEIEALPSWNNDQFTLEQRARAYLDVNCASCHSPGGFAKEYELDLRFEIPFEDSNIYRKRNLILLRMEYYFPGFSMPYIGVTFVHQEGFDLVKEYLESF